VGDFPLTILVHGWGGQSAKAFLAAISLALWRNDALWLIPVKETQLSIEPAEVEGAVVLDLSRETDQRTYRNLIGDVVFFPALEESEGVQISEWSRRARAFIIDGSKSQVDAVLRAACEAMLMTYRWSEETALEEYALG
jgi:hypothetical protein